ncbi:MAG: thiosulfate sulfurtransferase [Alphaproteobacteria bacterium]|nr:thiosulfate sulfurtransferase [Alphaproteobacteria bacterium]MCB9928448.1 thiosulfate sulfurtransferase [Alphaproteobacteria bacterium]
MPAPTTPEALHDLILKALANDGTELAIVDVREEQAFADNHLLYAISVPLSRLELLMADLAPRKTARVVVCAAGDGDLATRAAAKLEGYGYAHVGVLEGGVAGWSQAGYETYAGFNVPSKAFGEHVEHHFGTPSVTAEQLNAMMQAGENMVILDSRPMDEYHTMNIPGGICCPGGELVYRVQEIAPDPSTTVVVNCAGRTRSIIGAQSLINAGIPNKVVALQNGTMGWHLSGFQLEHGNTRLHPDPSATAVDAARQRAGGVDSRFRVAHATLDQVRAWERDPSRSVYLVDVRTAEEFAAGHLPGSKHAPGGQLVQATDRYAGVRGARVVTVCDTGVRSTMAAHWLKQMNWDVYVLEGGLPADGLETGAGATPVLGDPTSAPTLAADALKAALDAGETAVIDLGYSRDYRKGHIPGAHYLIRSRLEADKANLPAAAAYVATSEDGLLAAVAAAELSDALGRPVTALAGGTAAWVAAGYPLEAGESHMASEPNDVWLKPYERKGTVEDFMNEYLTWEIALVDQIKRDDTVTFWSP